MGRCTQDVIEAVAANDGIVVLAPPFPSKMADHVDTVVAAVGAKKKVLVCESYGGKDEPVDSLNAAFMVRSCAFVHGRETNQERTLQQCFREMKGLEICLISSYV